jgi:hypothetical protein
VLGLNFTDGEDVVNMIDVDDCEPMGPRHIMMSIAASMVSLMLHANFHNSLINGIA